jgi:biopolymer transport protein ExbB/TolQ
MARFKTRAPNELLYSLFAFIIVAIAVHTVYVTVVRPRAATVLAEQRAAMQKDANYVAQRSVYVVLKDWEQESAIILALWAVAVIGYKAWAARGERALLERDLVNVPAGMRILPEDVREYARPLEALPLPDSARLLPRALLVALYRFGATRNVQDVSEAARGVCEGEADRLDSELSMLRYVAWAIPAIGFIGTVRVSGVTAGLGTAFNSTLIALLISIVLMFLLHQLQLAQERLVLDSETYLDQYLIRHMQVR